MACVAKALSVGAVWDATLGSETWFGCTDATTQADQVTCWSNSSATTDVFAPGGVMTTSLKDGGTANVAGTSFATPMASACAAALRQAFPAQPLQTLVDALVASTTLVTDTTSGLSFPRLDCEQALAAAAPSVPSLSRGSGLALLALLIAGLAYRSIARR